MKPTLKQIFISILCIILVCSFFSCGEKRELQVLFYGESVSVEAEGKTLVIGCDDPDLDSNIIDTLVVPDAGDMAAVEALMSSYSVSTVYIPDNDELYMLCDGYSAFTVRVEGSMSFGIGGASVSVSAGESSLMTAITLGGDRLLICGDMSAKDLEQLRLIDQGSFGYVALSNAQKDFSDSILSAYKPHTLVFTGTEPYVEGYTVTEGSITLKE